MTFFERAALRRMFPRGQPAWLDALEIIGPELAARHGVTSAERWRQLAAQIAAETDGLALRHMRENMHYSAARLLEVYAYRIGLAQANNPRFRGRSRAEIAHELAGNPDLLAETVYGGRSDIGNSQPGDGARYIGRGPLQTTGREWYAKLGRAIGVDLLAQPELLEEPYVAWKASFAEWEMLGCNALADRCSVDLVSRRVNGGTNGLARRRAEYHRASVIWDARFFDARSDSALRSRPDRAGTPEGNLRAAAGLPEASRSAPRETTASNENDDWTVEVTPRHAESVPAPVTAASVAADGSRSMSTLLAIKRGLGISATSLVSFLGLDSFGGFRGFMSEFKGLINDHSVVVVIAVAGIVLALYGGLALAERYLVAAARDGRYDPVKSAADEVA